MAALSYLVSVEYWSENRKQIFRSNWGAIKLGVERGGICLLFKKINPDKICGADRFV